MDQLRIENSIRNIVSLIERNRYGVTIEANAVQATDKKTGEVFLVVGDDALTMTAKLAGQCGMDLMDG